MAKKEEKKVTKGQDKAKDNKKPASAAKPEKKVIDKSGFIAKVAEQNGKDIKEVTQDVNLFLDTIMNLNAEGFNVAFLGFGNFEVRERGARMGRNPQTGGQIEIAASKSPALKPGKPYRERVNSGKPEWKTAKASAKKEKVVEVDAPAKEDKKAAPAKDVKSNKKDKKNKKKGGKK